MSREILEIILSPFFFFLGDIDDGVPDPLVDTLFLSGDLADNDTMDLAEDLDRREESEEGCTMDGGLSITIDDTGWKV